jgi:hypothetical protein
VATIFAPQLLSDEDFPVLLRVIASQGPLPSHSTSPPSCCRAESEKRVEMGERGQPLSKLTATVPLPLGGRQAMGLRQTVAAVALPPATGQPPPPPQDTSLAWLCSAIRKLCLPAVGQN